MVLGGIGWKFSGRSSGEKSFWDISSTTRRGDGVLGGCVGGGLRIVEAVMLFAAAGDGLRASDNAGRLSLSWSNGPLV
jgi:hypothetical protein